MEESDIQVNHGFNPCDSYFCWVRICATDIICMSTRFSVNKFFITRSFENKCLWHLHSTNI